MQKMSEAQRRITADLNALGASWYQGNHEKVLLEGYIKPGQAYRAHRVRLPSGAIRNFYSAAEIKKWVADEQAKLGPTPTLDHAGNTIPPWSRVWWYDARYNTGYANAPVRAIYLTTRATKARNVGIATEMGDGSWEPSWVEAEYIEAREPAPATH